MKNIIITESQYKLLLKTIELDKKQQLDEGFKEVLIGAALLLNLNLSGQNKAELKQMEKDNNALEQLTKVLNNDSVRSKVVDYYESKGLKDVENKIINNNEKLIKALEKGKHVTSSSDVTTAAGVEGQLNQGRGLISMKEITVDNVKPIVKVDSTIVWEFADDNFFITGDYELNSETKSKLQSMIDDLTSNPNVTINSVKITSSTDTEPVRKYVTNDDSTGNVKLADLRIKSIGDIVSSGGGDFKITTNPLPNSGPNVYTRTMSSSDWDSARKETKEYRFAKIELDITVTPKSEAPVKKVKEVKYVCEFVTVHTGGGIKVKNKEGGIKLFKRKPSGSKLEIIGSECPLD